MESQLDADELCAQDMVDWSDDRYPRRGEMVVMVENSELLNIPADAVHGLVIGFDLGWSSKAGHFPKWRIFWSHDGCAHYLSSVDSSWFECGFMQRVMQTV